jgi:3-oxosteroid 1-dehydrogenase
VSRERRVVVLGSGAAGMAAAVAAAASGAAVTLLEAAPSLGGTTATSGGAAWIPNNPWAAAAGAQDSPAAASSYLGQIAQLGGDAALVDAYLSEAVRVAQELERSTPIRWQPLMGFPDYRSELDGAAGNRSIEIAPVEVGTEALQAVRTNTYGWPSTTITEDGRGISDDGLLASRRRAGIATRGRGLIAALYVTLRELGGVVRLGLSPDGLLISGSAVVGVRAGGEELRGQVVVASGGFERDRDLVSGFLGVPMTAPAGPPSNTGSALRMCLQAGAAVGNMSDAWFVPAMRVPGETIDGAPFYRMLFTVCAKPGGLIVDASGRRFVNEAMAYYGLGRSLNQFDVESFAFSRLPSWFVFDARRLRDGGIGPSGTELDDADWLIRAESIEELARRADIPESALTDSVARFNSQAASGLDSDFGRGHTDWDRYSIGVAAADAPLRGLTESPFYAIELLSGCSGTKGGMRIDRYGRVLRSDGTGVLAGLYAAGNAAAYPFGRGYPGPGATIGPALVFGWLAGETAAAAE